MIDNCADDWRIAMTWQRMMQIGERDGEREREGDIITVMSC